MVFCKKLFCFLKPLFCIWFQNAAWQFFYCHLKQCFSTSGTLSMWTSTLRIPRILKFLKLRNTDLRYQSNIVFIQFSHKAYVNRPIQGALCREVVQPNSQMQDAGLILGGMAIFTKRRTDLRIWLWLLFYQEVSRSLDKVLEDRR